MYPTDFIVRSVRHNGLIRWRGRHVYLGETLASEAVGFQPLTHDHWRVYFADVPLGVLVGTRFQRDRGNYRSRRIRPRLQRNEVLPIRPV